MTQHARPDRFEEIIQKHGTMIPPRIAEDLRAAFRSLAANFEVEKKVLREALFNVLPPEHGVHGGPLTGAQAIYGDGTSSDEISLTWISHEHYTAARAALKDHADE